MKILKFKDEESWLEARRGRITGTRVGNLVSKRNGEKKIGFYELIAERIAIPPNEENVMDRGKRLEDIAMEKFQKLIGKKINNNLVIWHRDEDENIAISPDGSIGKTIAVEVKCLSSARHVEAWITKEIPDEYEGQVLQYFIVNDKLRKLYFLFFDPRMPKDIFWIEVKRENILEKIYEYRELEKKVLMEVELLEQQLTF